MQPVVKCMRIAPQSNHPVCCVCPNVQAAVYGVRSCCGCHLASNSHAKQKFQVFRPLTVDPTKLFSLGSIISLKVLPIDEQHRLQTGKGQAAKLSISLGIIPPLLLST